MKTLAIATSALLLTLMSGPAVHAASPFKQALSQGRALGQQGNPIKALPHFQRALQLADTDRQKAEATLELGECFRETDDIARALPLLDKAVGLAEKASESDDILIAALANRALLLQNEGRKQEAYDNYVRCIAVFDKQSDPDLTAKAKIQNNAGLLHAQCNNHENAILLYKKSLESAGDDPSLAVLRMSCLGNMAISYKDLNDLAKADQCAREALAQAGEEDKEGIDYASVLFQQGQVKLAQKNYKEASPILKTACTIMERNLGKDSAQVKEMLESYHACQAVLQNKEKQ